jgi:hypothetical protein
MNKFGEKVSLIWSISDQLSGPYRLDQYKDVMGIEAGLKKMETEIADMLAGVSQ